MGKTHYRKVFKSDHLGVADLEDMIEKGDSLFVTIKQVKQEYNKSVAGKKGDFNIAYFKEDIKPLVLNSTNSKMIKGLTNSSFVDDWSNINIEMRIDHSVKMMREVVGGVRIFAGIPSKKPILTPDHLRWEDAKKAVSTGEATRESIGKHWDISNENWDLLCG